MDVMIKIISLRLRLAIASSDRVPLWPFPSRQYMPTRPGWSRWRHPTVVVEPMRNQNLSYHKCNNKIDSSKHISTLSH